MSNLPDNIGSKGSFLRDNDLKQALEFLFGRGTYKEQCIRHCCYQLRLGDKVEVYKQPKVDANGAEYKEFLPLGWKADSNGRQYIDIWPKKRALLYTRERFQLPDDVLGFVFSRGLLFAKGLAPETTYADPGFQGEFYITVVNINENAVRLYQEMYLAKLFIFKLAEPVGEGYVSGKEKGIEQQLLEIPVRRMWTEEELRKIKDLELLKEIRKGCSIGELLNQMIKNQIRFHNRNRLWIITLALSFAFFLLWPFFISLLGKIPRVKVPDWFGQEIIGGLTGFLFGLIPMLCQWMWKKITRKP